MKRTHLKQQGFTLTELMIVVALAAIFATLAVPNMGGMIARQRVQGQAAEIASAFTFAHNEAVRLGKPVFVVPGQINSNGKLNGAAADWDNANANAILVFADANDSPLNQTYNPGEDLRVVPLNNKIRLEITQETLGNQVGSNPHNKDISFVFYSNGQMRVRTPNTTSSGGHAHVLSSPGTLGRIVVKDPTRTTKNQANRFCDVVRVNATGRSSVYTGKRSDWNKTTASTPGGGTSTNSDFFYCE